MKISSWLGFVGAIAVVPLLLVQQSAAWGSDGHRMINRLAAAALPRDVPEFLRSPAGLDAMEYYGPEPDRWRSSTEPELAAASAPDHFIDFEYTALIDGPLPRKRYDFVRALAYAQKSHPDLALTPEKVGLQPYAATETWEKLKAMMRDYRTLSSEHKDVKPVECEILFTAGTLGHYVADGSQPLHATDKYNGWVGENPNNYTTLHKIHSQFETGFVKATVDPKRDIAPLIPARPQIIGDVFDQYVTYLKDTNINVEKVYQFEKQGALIDKGTPESRAFVNERLAAGATELRDLIYTAWVRSGDPLPTSKE